MPCPSPTVARRCYRLALAGLLLLAAAGAEAQAYGQWSWDASAEAVGRGYRNSLGGVSAGRSDETELGFDLGVNGFILHPAVVRLRLSGELAFSSYASTREVDQLRWGLGGSLNVLPQGRTPLSVYGSRHVYDFTKLAADDPLNLLGIPESTWTLGGRLRLRSGPLRGSRFGFDHTVTGYRQGEASRDSLYEDAFGEWARSSSTRDHRLYVERRVQDYATVDFRTEDLTLNYDLRARLGPRWRWEMFANGLHRNLDYAAQSSDYESGRTSQRFILETARRRTLELSYDGGVARGGKATNQSHLLQARYRFWPRQDLLLGPFVGWGWQVSPAYAAQLPQIGISANWNRRLGSLDASSNGAVSWVGILSDGPGQSALGLSLGASLGQGEDTGLRRDLDLSWASNRVRVEGDATRELPDLGTSLAGSLTEDLLSGRLTLRHRWSRLQLFSYTDASRRTGNLPGGARTPPYENLAETLQLSGSRVTLTGGVSASRVRSASPQEVSAWYAALTWRPVRLIGLTGSYRRDRRDLTEAPSLDGRRWEAQADLRIGDFVLRGQAFETRESSSVVERTNRGLIVSLTRAFFGWLPFVTGAPQGGTIQ